MRFLFSNNFKSNNRNLVLLRQKAKPVSHKTAKIKMSQFIAAKV